MHPAMNTPINTPMEIPIITPIERELPLPPPDDNGGGNGDETLTESTCRDAEPSIHSVC